MYGDYPFAIFDDDGIGISWRVSSTDLDEAERQAQKLADAEGCEFFVYSFTHFAEVARAFPAERKPPENAA